MSKKLPEFGTINVPHDREVPFGAITPAPVNTQDLFITSNWRIVRPIIDHETCTRCLTCYIACPDACWQYNEKEDLMEWNWKFCKGCQICINQCPVGALSAEAELDFEDGVHRLEKPF
jgi:pyruvate ferredoxin oxidoreductase delta subunit